MQHFICKFHRALCNITVRAGLANAAVVTCWSLLSERTAQRAAGIYYAYDRPVYGCAILRLSTSVHGFYFLYSFRLFMFVCLIGFFSRAISSEKLFSICLFLRLSVCIKKVKLVGLPVYFYRVFGYYFLLMFLAIYWR